MITKEELIQNPPDQVHLSLSLPGTVWNYKRLSGHMFRKYHIYVSSDTEEKMPEHLFYNTDLRSDMGFVYDFAEGNHGTISYVPRNKLAEVSTLKTPVFLFLLTLSIIAGFYLIWFGLTSGTSPCYYRPEFGTAASCFVIDYYDGFEFLPTAIGFLLLLLAGLLAIRRARQTNSRILGAIKSEQWRKLVMDSDTAGTDLFG